MQGLIKSFAHLMKAPLKAYCATMYGPKRVALPESVGFEGL